MAVITHAKFHFNWLMLTLIFSIWASEPPRAWRTTEKARPDRVKGLGGGDCACLLTGQTSNFLLFKYSIIIFCISFLAYVHILTFYTLY